MNSKTFKAVVTASLILISLLVGLQIANVAAQPVSLPTPPAPIYILNNGTIYPSTSPLTQVGNTYKFTGNINDTINVQRSNVVIDGNGFILTKPSLNTTVLMTPVGWLPGVYILDQNNVTVTNIAFEYCLTGISVENSTDITITQNTIQQAINGIVVFSSSNINIINNNIAVSSQGFATGMNFLPDNPQASNPENIDIQGNLITGIEQAAPTGIPQPSQYGIWGGFFDSKMIDNSIVGIEGIALYYIGSNNLITDNNFQTSYDGIFFTGDSNLDVNNTIYQNNFRNNTQNAVVSWISNPPPNNWDNGTVGNYWSDYTGNFNSDGIGDTPYIIQTVYMNYTLNMNQTVIEAIDHYPLMSPIDNIANNAPQLPPLSTIILISTGTNPSPSPISTFSPSTTPLSVSEFPSLVVLILSATGTLLILVYFKKSKHQPVG